MSDTRLPNEGFLDWATRIGCVFTLRKLKVGLTVRQHAILPPENSRTYPEAERRLKYARMMATGTHPQDILRMSEMYWLDEPPYSTRILLREAAFTEHELAPSPSERERWLRVYIAACEV